MDNISIEDTNKEQAFLKNLWFAREEYNLNEEFISIAYNSLNPYINNPNLLICGFPAVKYNDDVLVIQDKHTIEEIVKQLENNGKVLIYTPLLHDNNLHYFSKFI